VYVDYIVVTQNDHTGMESLKNCLITEFEIKELGKLKYILALKWLIPSWHFNPPVLDLLVKTGKLGCKPIETPINRITNLMS